VAISISSETRLIGSGGFSASGSSVPSTGVASRV
jgi:hypothetical protein